MSHRNIVTLMKVPSPDRNADWLQEALANAVLLELATLPPYLCAYWSIREGEDQTAAALIHSIFMQEMKHMGLALNMFMGVGGTLGDVPHGPEAMLDLIRQMPTYPGPLPGGVMPELTVYLAGLTKDYVQMCMAIETPEKPLAKAVLGAEPDYTSIGAFYDAIINHFKAEKPEMDGQYQVEAYYRNEPWLAPVATWEQAIAAVDLIKREGEGTSDSPDEAANDSTLAHYYKFGSIFHGHMLKFDRHGNWAWTGAKVPFPDTWEMAKVPAGGWAAQGHLPNEAAMNLGYFNRMFTTMLMDLQGAWTGKGTYFAAISKMNALGYLAVQLMKIPINGNPSKRYGPDFQVIAPDKLDDQGPHTEQDESFVPAVATV